MHSLVALLAIGIGLLFAPVVGAQRATLDATLLQIQQTRLLALGDSLPLDVCALSELFDENGRVRSVPNLRSPTFVTRAQCEQNPDDGYRFGTFLKTVRRSGDSVIVSGITRRSASLIVSEDYVMALRPNFRGPLLTYCILGVQVN